MLIDILELACLIKKEEEERNEKKINDGNLSGKYKKNLLLLAINGHQVQGAGTHLLRNHET